MNFRIRNHKQTHVICFHLSVVCQRQACWWRPMWREACWCLTMWWPDWCCPDWNSWAVTAGCWMVRRTGLFFVTMNTSFFSFLCFTFSLTLTHSTLPHYSVFIVCSEVGRDVFIIQPHGSVRNCQLSFKSDWPPLGATPQILTLKAREGKKERKKAKTHFCIFKN